MLPVRGTGNNPKGSTLPGFLPADRSDHFETSLISKPVHLAMNAYISENSSMILSVGLPDPCPARVSIRMRRSEEHTSELQSLMRISYAVFCLKKKNQIIISQV